MQNIAEMILTVKTRKNRVVTKHEITGEALLALRSCGTSRQGMTPRGGFSNEAIRELRVLGLIGPKGGLTRDGSYAYLDTSEQIEAAQGW